MKIFHIITSIDYGGSQNILFNICKKDLNNEHLVISLKNLYKYKDNLTKYEMDYIDKNLKS